MRRFALSLLLLLLPLLFAFVAAWGVTGRQPPHHDTRHDARADALCAAAATADLEAVRCLLAQGADPNRVGRFAPDEESECKEEPRPAPPLQFVVRHSSSEVERLEVVKALLNAGADPNGRGMFGITPLMWATDKPKMVRLLLTRGARVNQRDERGNTALFNAVQGSKIESVEALITAGADVVVRNASGETPLHVAANAAIARLLLWNGAGLNSKDNAGRTPLVAAAADGRIETAKALTTEGASVNEGHDQQGYSALQWAIKNNAPELVHRLLARGAVVNPPVSTETPLLLAAKEGLLDSPEGDGSGVSMDRGPLTIARLLLRYGANIRARNADGRTPLIEAALYGDDLMVALLLKYGANPNDQDAVGYTALHWGVVNCQPRVVRVLVQNGADVCIEDHEGKAASELRCDDPTINSLLGASKRQ